MLVLLIVNLWLLFCSHPVVSGSCNISTVCHAGVWTQCVCWLFGSVGGFLCVSLYFDIRKIALSISVVFVVFIVQLWWSCLVHGGPFAHPPALCLDSNACVYVCRNRFFTNYRYTSSSYTYVCMYLDYYYSTTYWFCRIQYS